MATRTILVMVLIAAVAQPTVAEDWNPSGDTAMACYLELLVLSGYGRFSYERAAFLVLEQDGSLACMHWPPTFQYERIDYKGGMPANVVAVVHTHPYRSEHPSAADRAAAKRLRLPFVVVAPTTLSIIDAHGATTTLAAGNLWWKKAGFAQ